MLLATMALLAQPLTAQVREIEASGAAQCSACHIELEHVARIGSAHDEHLYGQLSLLARGRTAYFVANGYTPGVVLVYDTAGRFVRTIGRSGRGPGELSGLSLIHVTPEDSLQVFSNGRITVFSTSDGAAVRSWNVDVGLWGLTGLRGGITAATIAPNARRETVRVFNRDGSRRASILFEGLLEHRDQLAERVHSVGDTLLLVSATGRYELRAFDSDGALRWKLKRAVEWFTPYARQPPNAPFSAPSLPDVVGAWIEADRYLWVLLERPADDWRPAGPSRRPEMEDFNALFSSQLEVFDLVTGRLLASRRLDWLQPTSDGRPLLYTTRSAESGEAVIDVWRASLVQPSMNER